MRANWNRSRGTLALMVSAGLMPIVAVACTSPGHGRPHPPHPAVAPISSAQLVVTARPYSVTFVRSTPAQLGCVKAAQLLGYPVPCPVWLPQIIAQEPGASCADATSLTIMLTCEPDPPWRGWMFGNGGLVISGTGPGISPDSDEHFVMEATPFPTDNYDLIANGPVWYGLGRPRNVRAMDWVTVGGRRMRFVMIPQDTAGSAMAGHLALVWTAGSHTYAITFHVLWGVPLARALDLAVAQRLVMISPPSPAPHASATAGG